jgi:DNA-binding winged helix-turn-helix (wHTH) protein
MKRAPNIVSRQELISVLWEGDEPEGSGLRNHIYQLRNLVDRPFAHAYIKTIAKVGYQLTED